MSWTRNGAFLLLYHGRLASQEDTSERACIRLLCEVSAWLLQDVGVLVPIMLFSQRTVMIELTLKKQAKGRHTVH